MLKLLFLVIAIVLAVVCSMIIYNTIPLVKHEYDFYDYHVWECEECQKINGTFHLCSGFCTPTDDEIIYAIQEGNHTRLGIDVGCSIQLWEDCRERVPHGSLTGNYELVTLKEHFGGK